MSSSTDSIISKLNAYERLVRLDKPIGWMLLLWPTLLALWFGSHGLVDPQTLWIFILGTILMRSAGCAVNDAADRDFDKHVTRTKDRPVATGEISRTEAIVVAAVLALSAFFLVVFGLHPHTLWWCLPALAIAIAYPFAKRFMSIPQAFLGIAFSFGIPMAYAAANGTVARIAWIMLAVNFFWVMAYDTEYAMNDRPDDEKLAINTSAKRFGRYDVAVVVACYVINLAGWLWIGHFYARQFAWLVGVAVAAGIAAYHYRLIQSRKPEDCFKAFRHNAWYGAALLAGLVVDYWFWPA